MNHDNAPGLASTIPALVISRLPRAPTYLGRPWGDGALALGGLGTPQAFYVPLFVSLFLPSIPNAPMPESYLSSVSYIF
jgi:hypothetical protein